MHDLPPLKPSREETPGPDDWRTLEAWAETEACEELLRNKFPHAAALWSHRVSRRRFLAVMGASLALAGVTGCSVRPAPQGTIVPYVHPPEEIVPGRPLFFATTLVHDGGGFGLLVESHEGRPTKIEGNPDHPASLGATTAIGQASVLGLYDPDRSATVTHLGYTRTWPEALTALRQALARRHADSGVRLRVLSEPVVSPTLADQLQQFLAKYPDAHWHTYEPLSRDQAYRGAEMAFGRRVTPRYDFAQAEVIVSLDADFLASGPGSLRYTADFMGHRRVRTTPEHASEATMNRLYQVETDVTCTGAKADHRLAVRPSEIEPLARALAIRLGIAAGGPGDGPHARWIAAVAQDLEAHRGRCLVLAGRSQPPVVHLLAHVLNDHLGNVGHTVTYLEPIETPPSDQVASLRELVLAMQQGQVDLLLILGGNPVYTAPADIPFASLLERVPLRVHLGLYQDETARLCHWHLPESHALESWGDARAFDGTASLAQPLIEPLYDSRSALELLGTLLGSEETPGRELVRSYWQKQREKRSSQGDFDTFWQTTLHDGVLPDTASSPQSVSLQGDWQKQLSSHDAAPSDGFEIAFRADPLIHDGRYANNAWLQECPRPISRIAWGNAVLMSPATAAKLGLEPGRYAHGGEHGGYQMPVVELRRESYKVEGPVWIVPGHADGAVTVYLGFGRSQAGRVGGTAAEPVGFDAYRLRTADHPWFASGVQIVPTLRSAWVACTQAQASMENRQVVRAADLQEYHENPKFAKRRVEEERHSQSHRAQPPLTLYRPFDYSPPKHRWGMLIDLTTCIGCQACVVACQAENNIPVVGKEQVLAGREMHWLRIDRYLDGPSQEPEGFYFQPLPCMHCEQAPCEYVCPTEATVHSAEGLNEMVYNRCVGTRFCSNNCPYKVRRFNFFFYADYQTPSRRLQYNPDVTVRSRGVMEKCSYCVQRIRQAEIDALSESRPLVEGEVQTACQAACPAQAIVFGDLNDPKSQVAQGKESPLEYSLLGELNTMPRTTYLAALRNPNPDLENTT